MRWVDGALEVALRGHRRRIDVGAIGDDRFVVMSGMGFDAAMLRDADADRKARMGAAAYVISGLANLRRVAEFELRLDGGEPVRRAGRCVLVGNLGRLQGGLPVFPDARPDDGLLDVAVVQASTVVDWLRVAVRVLTRRRGDDPVVEVLRARHIDLRCDRPQPVERDGDVLDPTDHVVVEVVAGALTLCVPEERIP